MNTPIVNMRSSNPEVYACLEKMNMNPRENGKGMVIGVVEWPMFMVGMAGQRGMRDVEGYEE